MTRVFDMMALNVTGVPQESPPRDESIASFAYNELLGLGTDFAVVYETQERF
jgi:hypothetical protein